MKTRFLKVIFVAASVMLSSSLFGQVTLKKISSDRISASGIHTPYKFPELNDAPAPEGYVPFYISHTGRHGSRFNTNEKELLYLKGKLAECDKAGILTADGKELKRRIDFLHEYSQGRFGALSDRGALEHRTIAARMFGRYPEVFAGRKTVTGASSTSIRCILSMANFGTSLASCDGSLKISYRSDDCTKKYLMKNTGIGEIEKQRREMVSPIRKEMFDPERFFRAICTDQDKVRDIVDDRRHFCKDLYVAGGIVHCLDLENEIELYDFFTDQELCILARLDCYDFYGDHANSKEFGKKRVAMADELVQDITNKADAALKGNSDTAADLRFTHDWVVSPLYAMIGIKGMEKCIPLTSADKYWMTSDYIPMASNLQMVFYKSDKSKKILVKILLNEEETSIPGLKAEDGPYYDWNTLKTWLEGRIKQFCD